MMMKVRLFALFGMFLMVPFTQGYAQTTSEDSVLSYASFLTGVYASHPFASIAELEQAMGDAAFFSARGNFDPKIFSEYDEKEFDKKTYFTKWNSGISLPTSIFGLEAKLGYEQNTGVFLNPESSVPTDGLVYAGVKLPLFQGLLLDERRAAHRNARIGIDIARAEADLSLSSLLMDATVAYWDWAQAKEEIALYQEGLRNARSRFQFLRGLVKQGDRPAVDTLEALIQVNNFTISLRKAEFKYEKARQTLLTFRWDESYEQLPYENKKPEPLNNHISLEGIDTLNVQNNPELRALSLSLKQLDISRRLKVEKMKPKLDVNYNFLSDAGQSSIYNISTNQVKFGVNFSYPIPTRTARGDVEQAEIKIKQTDFKLLQKEAELEAKLEALREQIRVLKEQSDLFATVSEQSRVLLRVERQKFDNGESSLFLINSRENKYIKARIDLIQAQTDFHRAKAMSKFLTGQVELSNWMRD